MKFTNAIKFPVMVAVMGCGLMLAKPAAAQQDVNPTDYNEGPNMVSLNQPVNPEPVAQVTTTISANSTASIQAEGTQAAARKSSAAVSVWALSTGLGTMLLIATIVTVSDNRRRNGAIRGNSASDPASV